MSERLQQAGSEYFVEGVIGSGVASVRRLLAFSRQPDRVDELLTHPAQLTDELAWAVRAQAQCHLGVALHAVADPADKAENLAKGQTFISVTDGKGFKNRTTNLAGRGRPDRTRMSLNAMGLVRLALLDGM